MTEKRPDSISPADRVLIEDHIRRRGVTVIPRGVSGLCESDHSWQKPGNKFIFRGRGKPVDEERRDEYRRLVAEGRNIIEIAEAMSVTKNGARNMLRKLGIKAAPMRRVRGGDA